MGQSQVQGRWRKVLECRGLYVGPASLVSACGVAVQVFCGLVLWLCSKMLGEFGRMGNVPLLGFMKRKGPKGLRDLFLNACEVTGEGLSACFRDEPHVKRENRPACPARAHLATQAGHGACGSPPILHLPHDALPSV